MAKMTRADRAKQFLPFNALKGYYDLIRAKEVIVEDKKELSEEDIKDLQFRLSQIKKGDVVKIKYYQSNAYTLIEGMVGKIDTIYHTITIVKKTINFDDIISIEGENIQSYYKE